MEEILMNGQMEKFDEKTLTNHSYVMMPTKFFSYGNDYREIEE